MTHTHIQNLNKDIKRLKISPESLRLSPSFLATLLFFVYRVSRSHGGFVSPSHHGFTTLRVGTLVIDVPARNYRMKADPSLLDWVSPSPVTPGVTRPARVSPPAPVHGDRIITGVGLELNCMVSTTSVRRNDEVLRRAKCSTNDNYST